MKARKLKMQVGICSFLIAGAMVLGGAWWTFVKGTEANLVDFSKGITHDYESDTDTKGFINLNGNSVIITESENSTNENQLCNIYLDTNRNGLIDEGEEKTSSVEMDATLPIYGIYKQSSTTPISITVQSGQYSKICGVYQGTIITESTEEAACTMRMQDGNVGDFYASRASRIESSKATAIDMDVTGGTIGNCVALQQGSVTTTTDDVLTTIVMNVSGGIIQGSCQGIQNGGQIIASDNTKTALSIAVTGEADIKGAVYGVQGSAQIKGNIDLQVQPENNRNLGAIYGINEGVMVDGSVTINLDNITVGGVQFIYGNSNTINRINGDVSLTAGRNVSASAYYLFSNSSTGGDITVDLYGNMQENATIGVQCYGVQYSNVEGKVDITLRDGLFQNVVGVQNGSVTGDVDVSYLKGTYTASCWGVMQATVGGDLTITSGDTTEFTGSCNFQGCGSSSTIEGNVIVDIYNTYVSASSVSSNFSGVNISDSSTDYYVAGTVDVKLHGGTWSSAVGISLGDKVECRSDCKVELEEVQTNNIEGIRGGTIKANASVHLTNSKTFSSPDKVYGIYNSMIEGEAIVSITGISGFGSIYGVNDVITTGKLKVIMENNSCFSYPGYIFGANKSSTGEDLIIEMKGCSTNVIYGAYSNCEVKGSTDITIQNCVANNYLYGMQYVNCAKNAILTSTDNQLGYFVGIADCTILGNVIITSSGDLSLSDDYNKYSGIQRGTVDGDVIITTKDCKYGNYYGIDGAQCNGDIQITIDGGIYTGNTNTGSEFIPYSCPNASHSGEKIQIITVFCKNVEFAAIDSTSIHNRLADGYQLTMTIDDSCTVGDNYKFSANAQDSGDALLRYGDDYYYAGNYPISKDVTANNIFFGKDDISTNSANLLIPENVTMTATGKIYLANQANVLIEGSLKGTIYESNDNNYCNGTIYMNGGIFEDSSKVRRLYYPVTFSYPKKAGTIAPAESKSNIETNSLRPEVYFGFVGAEITITCEAKKGYTLDEVTVTKGEEIPEVLTASIGTNYCFGMDACPAEVTASFTGNPITLGKKEDSLTTKLYEKTTKDNPLYDLTDITISGDGEEGDVIYEIGEDSELPEGLVLEEGKIFGAATQAFEDGTDVVITVTGRNGTTAQFTLYITVMAGDEEGNPAYAVPEDLTAVYGDTLDDVELPSDENGAFTWQQDTATSVGDAGEHEFLVTYTPTNDKYKTVTDIKVTVTVQKAKAEFTKVEELTAKHEDTLNDLTLPEVENGEYYWITSAEVKPEDGEAYDLGFRPADAKNYDWEKIEGWDEQAGSVLMTVTIKIQHNYGTAWEKDEINHWHVCECGQVQEKIAHAWDEGIITKEATEEENGIKEYHCTVCEAVKEEVIPAIGHIHVFHEAWVNDEENHWHVCECGEVQGKTVHTWDAGVVTKEATEAENGSRQYTCTVCGKTKEEVIKATGDTGNNPSQGSTGVNPPQQGTTDDPKQTEKQAASKGTILTDSTTKAKYKVISSENEEPAVQYVSSTDAAASAVTIASSVTIDGVDYKITEIADNAFKNNKKLKKVTIAGNIVTIGKSAFQGCTALTSVKLGSSVKTIKDKAFYGCKKLSTLTLGANVTILGKSVFESCISLKKVTIPKKVTKIGSRAFYNCKKLVNITIKTTKLTTKNVGSKAFTKAGSSNYKKLKVKVPKSKLKTYKTLLKKKGLSAKAKITK